jgi:hypothetical protein
VIDSSLLQAPPSDGMHRFRPAGFLHCMHRSTFDPSIMIKEAVEGRPNEVRLAVETNERLGRGSSREVADWTETQVNTSISLKKSKDIVNC